MSIEFKQIIQIISEKVGHWVTVGIKLLPNIGVAILIVIAFYFLAKLGRYAVRKIDKHTAGDTTLIQLLANVVYAVIVALGLFAALSVVQLDKAVTSLLAGAGIIGLALGFAFQDTAANLLAGILIAIRKPIKIGDIIKSNDEMGVIHELNLRSTVIRNFQGEAVYIPNKKVLFNNIVNYSTFPGRRLDLQIGISYGDKLTEVKDITLGAVKEIENLDPDKETFLWFEEFGDSSINFTLAIWMKGIDQATYRTFKSDIVMAVKAAFDANNITIPFPIRTLDFGIKGGEKLSEMKMHIAKNADDMTLENGKKKTS